ncbi:diguanylate cyclase [compost metagenome]
MDDRSIHKVADRIKTSLSHIHSGEISVGASIGVCVANGEVTLDEMIQRADESMYGAKKNNAGQFPNMSGEQYIES